jgi:Restriction endonuclease
MLVTVNGIGRVHIVFTETGENALIQPQIITPSTVADLLRDLGYRDVRRTRGAGDLNVDIWCRDPNGARLCVMRVSISPRAFRCVNRGQLQPTSKAQQKGHDDAGDDQSPFDQQRGRR